MKTFLLSTSGRSRGRNVRAAARLIQLGKLVAFPTETVYGLGANAYDTRAVREIFRVKGRPPDNPLIVHVSSLQQVWGLVRTIPIMFRILAERFMPGPLTVVLWKSPTVPPIVTAGLPTVAIRIPDHPVARALLMYADVPVVAPSANLSGRPSPTKAMHVKEDLDGKIAAILDGGACKIGVESTVLDLTRKSPIILRPGGITKEALEDVLGIRVRLAPSTRRRPSSPGMKYKHYAPKADVVLFEGERRSVLRSMKGTLLRMTARGRRVGVMGEEDARPSFRKARFFSLGTEGALSAARRVFSGFRALDRRRVDVILCQGFPEKLLGSALMNRLRKAAARRIRV